MTSDDRRARYLESGAFDDGEGDDRLDLIRQVMADESTWADPPPGIYESVVAAIDPRPSQPEPVTARSWPRWAAAGVAALVALVALLGTLGVFDAAPEPETVVVAMAGTELAPEAQGAVSLREHPSGWWIWLEVEGLPPAPEDTYYQGWVWRDGEGVSIGTFHLRGGTDPVTLWAGVDVNEYPSIWITLQDEGGGTEASDRVMMRGEITALAE